MEKLITRKTKSSIRKIQFTMLTGMKVTSKSMLTRVMMKIIFSITTEESMMKFRITDFFYKISDAVSVCTSVTCFMYLWSYSRTHKNRTMNTLSKAKIFKLVKSKLLRVEISIQSAIELISTLLAIEN